MNKKLIQLEIPKYLWQCLIVMAEVDCRKIENFIIWLLHKESENRNLIFSEDKDWQNLTKFDRSNKDESKTNRRN